MKRIYLLFTIVAGVFLLGLIVYWPSFHAPFQLDDYGIVVGNPLLHQIKHPEWILQYDPSRFITHLSFAFNYHFGGLNVAYYHTTNFILHLLVCFLVYAFCVSTLSLAEFNQGYQKKDIPAIALAATLIFLVHPLQTSAVTYIAQRATLLVSFFYLASLNLYIYGRKHEKRYFYFLSIIFAFFGIFCKPIIVTLPLVIILYEMCIFEQKFSISKKALICLIPYVFIAALVPVLLSLWKFDALSLKSLSQMTRLSENISRQDYLLTQFNVLVTYLRLFFLPVNQNLDYEYPLATSLLDGQTLYRFIFLLLLIVIAVRLFRRRKVMALCIFWFFACLSLESSIFPLPDVIFEHRMYLPLLGLSLLVSLTFKVSFRYVPMKVIAVSLFVFYFGILSYQRNLVWSDKFSLLLDVVAKSPNKSRVYNSLGLAYAEIQLYEPALDAFNAAIQKGPGNVKAYNNRATVYRLQRRFSLALEDYNRVLKMDPHFTDAYFFRAQTQDALGNYTRALSDARKAQRLGFPVNPTYISNLTNKALEN